MLNVVVYPKCSTCKNAVKWLGENGIPFEQRHIIEDSLDADEIKELHLQSGMAIKRFFNTSGLKYRELELKDKLPKMTDEECYSLLGTDGMLVKRPLVYNGEGRITLGFKLGEYESQWL